MPVLLHGNFIWDDHDYVTSNATLLNARGLWHIWTNPGATYQYYPLVHTTFWLEYHAWQLWPTGYHLTNVLLHACNALLVWLLLRRIAIPGAWFAAAIFALHPVHVESVAWITERKNVLSGLFYLVSLILLLGRGAILSITSRRYILGLLLFVCALLSKTITCTLPFVILLLAWWKQGHVTRAQIFRIVPLLLIGAGFALLTIWMEHRFVGARGTHFAFTVPQRLIIAGRAFWFYPAKLLWPRELCFFYPKWPLTLGDFSSWLLPLCVVFASAIIYAARKRISRAPAAAFACYVVTIAPALGFVNVYPMRFTYVSDHYQYLASIPLIAIGIGACAQFAANSQVATRAWHLLSVVVLAVLFALTWKRAAVFTDAETLWRDTLLKNPTSEVAHNNLGNLLTDSGRVDEGITHYKAVIALNPDDDSAHFNLAATYVQQKKLPEAIAEWREAIRVRPRDYEAHFELGRALESTGQTTAAQASYERSLQLHPDFSPARAQLNALRASTSH